MKKIIALILVVVMAAAAAVLCTSCAKKEEPAKEEGTIKFTLINQTGETVSEVKLTETVGDNPQSWKAIDMADGAENAITVTTVLEKGAPSLDFAFATESGQAFQTMIFDKGDKTITMKPDPEGGVTAEIKTN